MNIFLKGKIMPVDRIIIKSVTVHKSQVKIKGDFLLDSALAFKDFKYRVDGNDLYIVIYRVLVSPIYKYGKVDITIEKEHSNFKNVYLDDASKTRLVWHKE